MAFREEMIPPDRHGSLVATTGELANRLNGLYGLYLDATTGFKFNFAKVKESQEGSAHLVSDPDELDQVPMSYGHGDPEDPGSRLQHQTTQGEYKARNAPGGANFRFLSHTFIVFAYQLWEEEYRGRIAELLGKETNELSIPLLGDIRLLRHDILKHRGVLTEDKSKRLQVIHYLVGGQYITFSESDIEQLVREIKAALDNMVLAATGTDPEFRKEWRLQ